MIPHIEHGDRMSGLLVYLAGPGRANEHESPHLVAGDGAMMAWHSEEVLDRDSALSIARHLDRPRKAFDVDVPGGHVWHCSLAVNVDEGILDEAKWQGIAEDFVAGMGFDDQDGSRDPCRWVAVHHGLSKGGNDHIHIVVNRVREDGTKASIHNDHPRAQKVARALEIKHGLRQLDTSRSAPRGYSAAEAERVSEKAAHFAKQKYMDSVGRASAPMPEWSELSARQRQQMVLAETRLQAPRNDLARTVRGAATASESEAEFVRRLRGAGLIVRPFYAKGTMDVIDGYSVGYRPEETGHKPVMFGGGRLGRDLTLPRLRAQWEDAPQAAMSAAAEWNSARRNQRVVSPGREATAPTAEQIGQLNTTLSAFHSRLADLDPEDRSSWESASRQIAGVYAAWSKAVEPTPGPLARAADAMSAVASTTRHPVSPKKVDRVAASSAAMVITTVVKDGRGSAAEVALLKQMLNLSGAVYDALRAQADAQRSAVVLNDIRGQMTAIQADVQLARSVPVRGNDKRVAESAVHTTTDGAVAEALDQIKAAEKARKEGPAPSPVSTSLTSPTRTPATHSNDRDR